MKSWKLSTGVMALLVTMAAVADRVPPGTDDEISERLQPFGDLCRTGDECAQGVAGPSAGGAALSGEQVYNQFCAACHAAGVAGAPKMGDAAAWEPRIAQGMDTLWEHTLNGINAMPPKGTCINCSDDELRSAMEYIVGQTE